MSKTANPHLMGGYGLFKLTQVYRPHNKVGDLSTAMRNVIDSRDLNSGLIRSMSFAKNSVESSLKKVLGYALRDDADKIVGMYDDMHRIYDMYVHAKGIFSKMSGHWISELNSVNCPSFNPFFGDRVMLYLLHKHPNAFIINNNMNWNEIKLSLYDRMCLTNINVPKEFE
jgi:hypothetical protein